MKIKNNLYLFAEAATRRVVRRSHGPASIREPHLESLPVDRATWGAHRAGDFVDTAKLTGVALERWTKALAVSRKIDRLAACVDDE